jgi:hypothetical protein
MKKGKTTNAMRINNKREKQSSTKHDKEKQ